MLEIGQIVYIADHFIMKIFLKNGWSSVFLFYPFMLSFDVGAILFSNNIDVLFPGQILRPLSILFSITMILWGGMYLITKDAHRSSYLCFLSILLFFFYDYLHRFLNDLFLIDSRLKDSQLIVIGVWCLFLGVASSGWLWEQIKDPPKISKYLSVILLFSLCPVLLKIGWFEYRKMFVPYNSRLQSYTDLLDNLPVHSDSLPDIYYIILDSYGRGDILMDLYNTDISSFTTFLLNKGFYVAEKSHSNYLQSEESIASSLNMQYLDILTDMNTSSRQQLLELIWHSSVRNYLEKNGYLTISLASIDDYTDIKDTDLYFKGFMDINPIEEMILSNSIISPLEGVLNLDLPFQSYRTHYLWNKYTFNKLSEIPELQSPKFVFVHMVTPHPPFVFDQNGVAVTPKASFSRLDANGFPGTNEEFIQGYSQQVQYINKRFQDIIEEIFEKSLTSPIIILQGDHGPRRLFNWYSTENNCYREAASILYAIYLPKGDYLNYYSSITPINTFRLIFNSYFGSNLPLLEDRIYFSNYLRPYDFVDITNIADKQCH